MDATVVGALAAVLGSIVGGSATVATTWITQRTQSVRERVRAEITRREALYGEFISECSRLFVDSLTHTLDKPEAILPLYAVFNRIRVFASDAVIAEAGKVLRRITEQYFSPNLSLEEMRALVQGGEADPVKPFGDACRAELQSMQHEP